MTQYLSIYTTCASKEEALKISSFLVEHDLVACCNILQPCTSVYKWEGKTDINEEYPILIKAPAKNFVKIEKLLKKLHSYEIPMVIGFKIAKSSKSYMRWMKEITKTAKKIRKPH